MPAPQENPDPGPFDGAENANDAVVDAEIVDAEVVDLIPETEQASRSSDRPPIVRSKKGEIGLRTSFEKPNLSDSRAANPTGRSTEQKNDQLEISIQQLSAKGGAVGSVLLSLLGWAGIAFSHYTVVNFVLAALMAVWGLRSPNKQTAKVGLCLTGLGLVYFFTTL